MNKFSATLLGGTLLFAFVHSELGAGNRLPKKMEALEVDAPTFTKISPLTPLTIQRGVKTLVYYTSGKDAKGRPQKLTFQVWNKNLKPLTILEWREQEADNIRLYVKPEGAEEWTLISPLPRKNTKNDPIARTPAELAPNTWTPVEIPFSEFLKSRKDHVKKAGGSIKYLIRAELNLVSVSADPIEFEIQIRNARSEIKERVFAE